MKRDSTSLIDVAWAGFVSLEEARGNLAELASSLPCSDSSELLEIFRRVADPDRALFHLIGLVRSHKHIVSVACRDMETLARVLRVLGASDGLAEFLMRHPESLEELAVPDNVLPEKTEMVEGLLAAGGENSETRERALPEQLWGRLRVAYRRFLLRIACCDLTHDDPVSFLPEVARCLSDLAGAVLDAAVAVARQELADSQSRFSREEIDAVTLAIVGMGKAGAGELNYVSDVDVMFVAQSNNHAVPESRALDIATRLAQLTMRGVSSPGTEPALWEVDANLRPEGKDGALVRSIDSYRAYYERWAHDWEFQALLKARPLAGDAQLARQFVDELWPLVWGSAARENFVASVQRMRERVTDNIPSHELDRQLKLGKGGLRDVEFTVQLLQLVHGISDSRVRVRATVTALDSLAECGYIGRAEAAQFGEDYRTLRLLEHRQQLKNLRRTHLMPRTENELRILGRASGLASSARDLESRWNDIRGRVRSVHERLFYRPLLEAVAALPAADHQLTTEQGSARLGAIGFSNPAAAIQNIRSVTQGVSRRAAIHKNLLPVLLPWFAEGADPDFGLLAYRRLSDALSDSPWYMRMLRDSSGAAHRLTRVLSNSHFVADLLERIPEAAAWLADEKQLTPRSELVLRQETQATVARHAETESAVHALKTARRREILRTAMASIVGICDAIEVARALTAIAETYVSGIFQVVRRDESKARGSVCEFAIIAMGRFGGRELGFSSDADVMYVYRPMRSKDQEAATAARQIASELRRLSVDERLSFELDPGLRPEGKNGPLVRSLDSYRAYYERWSLSWEAQALLRARGIVGDESLIRDFEQLADSVRYPAAIADNDVREIKRLKARVESERLPHGVDPARHVKLGRGSLSDIEWLAQLFQLEHGYERDGLKTTSTLEVLADAQNAGYLSAEEQEQLRDTWLFVSGVRSAMTLLLNKHTDVVPHDRDQLSGIAQLMGYPPESATAFEEDYMRMTRRTRAIFDSRFYGNAGSHSP